MSQDDYVPARGDVYIRLNRGAVKRTKDLGGEIFLDVNEDDVLVGIEALDVLSVEINGRTIYGTEIPRPTRL